MVCRNPFLDIQAYDSSDDEDENTPTVSDDEDFIAGGDDDEDRSWEAGDGVGDTGGIWDDEDAPAAALIEDSNTLTGALFLDDLERCYDPCNFQSKSPLLVPSSDDLLNKPTLHKDLLTKAVLMSEQRPLFWKIKCKVFPMALSYH
ncbi:hypothetical protein VKT23_009463 [Stygiomarasmius scandens]|uniref:Uncharacterized protein n=1 Tax=Marasmiellus scandens TaxID=2682957 RepID=A0ABR1JDS4_9AGAR